MTRLQSRRFSRIERLLNITKNNLRGLLHLSRERECEWFSENGRHKINLKTSKKLEIIKKRERGVKVRPEHHPTGRRKK